MPTVKTINVKGHDFDIDVDNKGTFSARVGELKLEGAVLTKLEGQLRRLAAKTLDLKVEATVIENANLNIEPDDDPEFNDVTFVGLHHQTRRPMYTHRDGGARERHDSWNDGVTRPLSKAERDELLRLLATRREACAAVANWYEALKIDPTALLKAQIKKAAGVDSGDA
jgi:hypothetical protein